jgi:hypothetical protein
MKPYTQDNQNKYFKCDHKSSSCNRVLTARCTSIQLAHLTRLRENSPVFETEIRIKSRMPIFVIPAQAGIQEIQTVLDACWSLPSTAIGGGHDG